MNTYAVFAELFFRLLNRRGRAGLIVPSGIATDHSTKAFFDEIVTKGRLVSLYDFENREAVFPGVHRSYKFCLLTLSGAVLPERVEAQAEFAFFLHQADQLRDPERRFALSAEDFALFNPNTRTCPIFRTRRDMEIARKMYGRAGVLWKEAKGGEPEVNPWDVTFQRMFDMSNDSGLFRTHEQLEEDGWQLQGNAFVRTPSTGSGGRECYLPLYEAKLFHQYDHRFATFEGASAKDLKGGNARPMTAAEKADAQGVVLPRYWVPEEEVKKRLDKTAKTAPLTTDRTGQDRTGQDRTGQDRTGQDRTGQDRTGQDALHAYRTGSQLALRDITNATNERTGVYAVIPPFGLAHTGTILIVGSLPSEVLHGLPIGEQQSPLYYQESP